MINYSITNKKQTNEQTSMHMHTHTHTHTHTHARAHTHTYLFQRIQIFGTTPTTMHLEENNIC
jgi:hypothetical protein